MLTIYDLAKLSESQIVGVLAALPRAQVEALLSDAQRAIANERAAGLGAMGSWLSSIIKGATKVLAPIIGGGSSQPVVVQVPTPAPAPAPEPSALEKSMPLILLGGGALLLMLLVRRR